MASGVNVNSWLSVASAELGVSETSNPGRVKQYHGFTNLPVSIRVPSTPWCSSFANYVMKTAGYGGTNSARALSWKDYGTKLDAPAYGSIGVIRHPNGTGHVGFVVGKNSNGNIILLGGNQGDQVKYSPFKLNAFVQFVVPNSVNVNNLNYNLQTMSVHGKALTSATTR